MMTRRVLPSHVGFIPDGNRRWAADHGLPKHSGYQAGIGPGLALYEMCKRRGIPEVSSTVSLRTTPSDLPCKSKPSDRHAWRLPRKSCAVVQHCWWSATRAHPNSQMSFDLSARVRGAASRSTSWSTTIGNGISLDWSRARSARRTYPDSISSSAGVEAGASAASCRSNRFMPTSTSSINAGPTSGRSTSKTRSVGSGSRTRRSAGKGRQRGVVMSGWPRSCKY